jgi:hypothetical protein
MHSTHRRIICSDANYRAARPSPLNAHHALADDVFSPPHRLALLTLERLPWLGSRSPPLHDLRAAPGQIRFSAQEEQLQRTRMPAAGS